MNKHPKISIERVEKFTQDNQWNEVNLFGAMYDESRTMKLEGEQLKVFSVPHLKFDGEKSSDELYDQMRVTVGEVQELFEKGGEEVKEAKVGDTFGPSWSTHW
eukprot:TRINITY_DN2973_c0_g1_i1.p1 TRINITY_DN2973_c0_g1~~TRINITY_DN2973_c0_g1_i1.p1  ORF type:complete len:110 (-),score=28.15 TRINITY_DN2973_c0_g1_i1:173-481(-)